MELSLSDRVQTIRGLFTTKNSGGFGRLEESLTSLNLLICDSLMPEFREVELGFCEPLLKNLVVRGGFVGYGRHKAVRIVKYSLPGKPNNVTSRILAISALWVEIIGSKDLDKLILECVKHVTLVTNEALQEQTRICSNLAEDILKSGLGVHIGEEPLSKLIGDDMKVKLEEDGNVLMQPTRSEIVNLLWALYVCMLDDITPRGRYWTNDSLVIIIYGLLKSAFTPRYTDFPVKLDFYASKSRFDLKGSTLPVYVGNDGVDFAGVLVSCTFDDFWELMHLHNRPLFPGDDDKIWFDIYQKNVSSMLEMMVKYTTMSPSSPPFFCSQQVERREYELWSRFSFNSASVSKCKDSDYLPRVQAACGAVDLHRKFESFAQVAATVGFFTEEELKEFEDSASTCINPTGQSMSRRLDLKLRTIALLVIYVIVTKSVANVKECGLQLFTPAMHASSQVLKDVLGVLRDPRDITDQGLFKPDIRLWRLLLVSAWFVGGKDIQYDAKKNKSDFKDCIGVMGPRATVILAGILYGCDDINTNCKLWICNGPLPDIPATNSGLILVDSTFVQMFETRLTGTFDKDVTVAPSDVNDEFVLDVGPSYGSDPNKIRTWIRWKGSVIRFFNPVDAIFGMLLDRWKGSRDDKSCERCMSGSEFKDITQDDLSGVTFKGWPISMSELVAKPGFLRFDKAHGDGGTASKLILLSHGNQRWRFCLAGIYDNISLFRGCGCADKRTTLRNGVLIL